MNWFRSKARSCTRLALFALAVQMAVSFGHMHRDDLGLPPFAATDQKLVAFNSAHSPTGPINQNPQPASDDYCPICASIALLATGMPALPPVLVVPMPIRRVWPSVTLTQVHSRQIALSFQARAPPDA
jgi:hypothetical protein